MENRITIAVDVVMNNVDQLEKFLEKLSSTVEKAAQPADSFEKLGKKIEEAFAAKSVPEFTKKVEKAGGLLGMLKKGAEGVGEALTKAFKAGDYFEGIAKKIEGAFSLESLVGFTKEAINAEAALSALSGKTGITVEHLSAMKAEAQGSGVGFDKFSEMITRFAAKSQDAVQKGGALAEAFRKNNIEFHDFNGNALPTEKVLGSLAEKFKTLDAAGRVKLAKAFFGEDGEKFVPLLQEVGEGIDALTEKQKGMGNVITDDQAKAAEEFNQKLEDLKPTFESIFTAVANELLPSLNQLVDWLKRVIDESGGVQGTAGTLVQVLKGLAVAVIIVVTAFRMIGTVMGTVLGFEFETLIDYFKTVGRIGMNLWDVIKALASAFEVLGKSAGNSADILYDFFTGKFKEGADKMRLAIGGVGKELGEINGKVKKSFSEIGGAFGGFVTRTATNAVTIGKNLGTDLGTQAGTAVTQINSLFEQNSNRASSPTALKPAPGSGNSSTVSEAAQKLMAEIDKAYEQSTKTKLELLAQEEAAFKKRVDDEIFDTELALKEKGRIEEIYTKKRQEILDKEQAERLKKQAEALRHEEEMEKSRRQLHADTINLQIDQVRNDPYADEVEKKAKLIPLLNQINDLIQAEIELEYQKAEAAGASGNEEEYLAAEKRILELRAQYSANQKNLSDVKSGGFSDTMVKGLRDLDNAWGDLGKNVANTALDGMQNAVRGVSDAIMGAIDGTKTWGEVFSQVGRSIIANLIQVVVQWVAQMLILKLLKKLFHTEDTQQAAQSAASWAPAAVAASIASYGAAATVGTAAAIAGMAFGAVFGAAMSSGAGFEKGGQVRGGEQMVRINEKGEEYVMPATHAWIFPLLEQVRTGAISARDLNAGLRGGLARPITSGSDLASSLPGLRGGGASNVQVSSAPATVVVFDDPQKYQRWLESSSGQHQVVNIVKANKNTIGIPS